MITKFDKTDVYEAEIKERIEELKILCNRENIPMFITLCVKSNNKETVYENDMIGTYANGINLKDDKFPKLVNVMNGFNTVPYEEVIELEY